MRTKVCKYVSAKVQNMPILTHLHTYALMTLRLRRLSGRKVCERVKTKGLLWKGKHLQARILHGLPRHFPKDTPSSLLVGVLTSTRLHKSAVKRNRMRRRCREALRLSLKNKMPNAKFHGSAQLLILPRSSSLSAPFDEILADTEHLLHSLTPRG